MVMSGQSWMTGPTTRCGAPAASPRPSTSGRRASARAPCLTTPGLPTSPSPGTPSLRVSVPSRKK